MTLLSNAYLSLGESHDCFGFYFLNCPMPAWQGCWAIRWDKGVKVLLRAQNNKSDLERAKHSNLKGAAQTISSSVFSTLPDAASPKFPALLCIALFSEGFIVITGYRQLIFTGPECQADCHFVALGTHIWESISLPEQRTWYSLPPISAMKFQRKCK